MKPKDVDSYIASFPKDHKALLKKYNARSAPRRPRPTEVISYNIPAYRQNGMLVYFAGFKHHIGLYPPVRGNAALEKAACGVCGAEGQSAVSLR